MAQVIKTTNVEQALKDLVFAAMQRAFPKVATPAPLIQLGKMTEYQCNNAMGLVKALSKADPPVKMNPQAIGEEIKANLPENDLIDSFVPTPKGFIDVTIRKEWVSKMVHQVLVDGIQPPQVEEQRILVDFSSPNIAKEMHVGHLRSTIIGESICRLLEFCGHKVDRINHLGDWGTAFGMLILYLKRNFPDYTSNPPDISDLTGFYRSAKACFDEDAEFKEQARLEVVKLQALDPESIKIWNFICDVSRKDFESIYKRLGVRIEERGESFYNPLIPKVLQLCEDAGQIEKSDGAKLIVSKVKKPLNSLDAKDMTKLANQVLAKQSRNSAPEYHPNLIAAMRKAGILSGDEGAEVVVLSKKETKPWAKFDLRMDLDKLMAQLAPLYTKTVDPLFLDVFKEHKLVDEEQGLISVPRFSFPLMAVKSDGGFNYDTTDIACMYHRFVMEKVKRNIYCTDVGQFEHFNMVAQVAKDMGWMDGASWDHAGFGLVTGADGKKMKTRSGDTVKLKELLDEAVERSMIILREREQGDRAQGFSEEEMVRLANVIGISAIKYFDLKQTRTSDYAFDYDNMLDMSGNTAVFLLYQYARICSIERKAGVAVEELRNVSEISMETKEEKALALCAFRFQSVILKTVDDLFPHHLADFAYELMSCFSSFFTNCRVIGDPLQNSRLCLVELTRMTLKQTMDILNIEVIERM